MDKNKQKKKNKQNIKIISASLLVIILVSMLAIPTSAVSAEDIVGEWTFDLTDMDGFVPNEYREYNATGYFYSYNPTTQSFEKTQLVAVKLTWNQVNGYLLLSDYVPDGYSHSITLAFIKRTDGWIWECIYDENGTDKRISSQSVSEEDRLKVCTFEIESISGSYYTELYNFLNDHATKVIPPPPEPDPLGNILDVFLGIGGWIATAVTSLIGIFYSAEAGKLTVIGVLSVASLAISVIFLLIGVIQNFMHFRS